MAFIIHDKLALVTVAEDTDWEAIMRQSRLARHVVKALSARAVLIEPEAVGPLVTWLRKNGHLPRVVI